MRSKENKQYRVDKNSPVPLYYQLKENILKYIEDKNLQPGNPIPSEYTLIDDFGVSRTTVRQALAELINEGVLETQRGRGTFISKPEIHLNSIAVHTSFNPQIIAEGLSPSTTVLNLEVVEPPLEVQELLKLKEGEKTVYLNRVRFVDGDPVVLVASYHPYPLCKDILESDMTKDSLYDVLNNNEDTVVSKLTRKVTAIKASREDAKILDIKIGDPIQYFMSVGINRKGIPVDVSYSKYVGDRSVFTVDILP